jgi:hypothetical protein
VYETPLFVGQGTPAIWLVKSTEVYIPYPLLDLNLWPLRRKHMFLTITWTNYLFIFFLQFIVPFTLAHKPMNHNFILCLQFFITMLQTSIYQCTQYISMLIRLSIDQENHTWLLIILFISHQKNVSMTSTLHVLNE